MVPNRRYQFEVIELSGTINHLEAFALWVGNGLEAGDFIEIEVNPYGSYQEEAVVGLRPFDALPWEFKVETAT